MGARGVSAPAYVVRLEVEAAPHVVVDALTEGESDRLRDWIAEHPAYWELVERPLQLRAEARAV
jgi:hypothetical protein